jgi:predicted Zn finger-like uncharacterized protein
MLLATRCPFCETVFRLDPAQLALRRGLVRCGHCQEVFDASSSLFEVAEGGDFASAKPVSPDAIAALSAGSEAAAAETTAETARPLNFSSGQWDPWAPVADAEIDNRLLHNASNLPFAPLTAGAAVTPRHAEDTEAEHVAGIEHREPVFAADRDEPVASEARYEQHASHETAVDETTAAEATTTASAAAAEPAFEPETQTPPSWRAVEHPADPLEDEPALPDPEAAAATLRSTPDHEPHFGTTATPFAANPPADDSDPFQVIRETRAAPPRRIGWRVAGAVVAVILLVVLLAQVAWWQREAVMVAWPQSQTLYAQACAPLGCSVMPPHDIDGLQVEPSDLRQIEGPHKLELKMPLRNRYNVALAYPAIELTLLDDQNNVAVRRVLQPQDYVKPGTPIPAGLPAHTTQTMIVHLDTGNAVASNFRVQIFYP